MQESKATVLCTRMLDKLWLNKAKEKGILIEQMPFIRIKCVEDFELKTRLQALSEQPVFAVFTSINAATIVTSDLSEIPDWKICCTSGVTKQYLINFFGEDAIVASAKNASLLADNISKIETVKPIIFFCGDQRLENLPQTLLRQGKKVTEIIVYTTEQTPVFIDKNYDAILFFSPSAVHSFFSVNTSVTNAVFFSIGKTTTAAIKFYSNNLTFTSEFPAIENMIELVAEYYL